ncbi:fungal protein [Blumeria hordei DH14]|uniref:Fungal protein n=1 Tax=Blumeria graminis f. sp. hordei (strain DH14) TaxID=546991 RepID=N1J5K1_BLUG1|nr:fungal protein [Blumeria hordei DH14]
MGSLVFHAALAPSEDEDDYGSDISLETERIAEESLLVHADDKNEKEPSHDPQNSLHPTNSVAEDTKTPTLQAFAHSVGETSEPLGRQKIFSADRSNPKYATQDESSLHTNTPSLNLENPDTQSPLELFRTRTRNLTVTDLVSPAWCELQYWYILTKHGEKKRTPAMKRGSRIHKKLEDQIFTTIHIPVQSKEDQWGIRLWNIVQGLHTLREQGLTRELYIWGIVEGQLVSGQIDELSYECPDINLERSTTKAHKDLGGNSCMEMTNGSESLVKQKKIYLCDVKTRISERLPSQIGFLPTKYQLMLYHRLITALITNLVDFEVLAARYNLDINKTFSDNFLAQVGGNSEVNFDVTGSSSRRDSLSVLLQHNCLSTLWALMISEFQKTFPEGVSSLGRTLKAEYRSGVGGHIIGSKTFLMNDEQLTSYVQYTLQWWEGKREARGVITSDAFKCQSCDFAETCEWRLKKVEQAQERIRRRKEFESNNK